ncbi:DNA primase [Mesomycoplasma molare]|uniref:DNA primase n=1 Tax=Mesomycoplasma molare TaxID=171288 RepID=A0ABY5TT88_9BACT|nr:DNA primase [Mesomycoplasma molare]UWD33889.1 DNA primase [Mesomycoplasma molare]
MYKNITEEIIDKIDIVSAISSFIPLSKKGNNYLAVCPFHGDSNPSLTVSPAKKIFKCFSCQIGGNIIDFIMNYNSFNFTQTLNYINENFNLNLNIFQSNEKKPEYSNLDKKIIRANHDANTLFKLFLKKEKNNLEVESFLKLRKLDEEIVETFEIGFSKNTEEFKEILQLKNNTKDILINASLITSEEQIFFKNRIIFPIKNEYGDIVAFSGRILNSSDKNNPKYINSAQNSVFSKSKILFNFHQAEKFSTKTNEIIICEGFMDVIALHKINIKNAVALMGTSLTEYHIDLLKNKKVLLLLDGDRAGTEATKKSIYTLLKNNIKVEIIKNNEEYDPDEILNIFGAEKLNEMLKNRVSPLSFVYEKFKLNLDSTNFISVNTFINNMNIFLKYSDLKEREFILNRIESEYSIKKEQFYSLENKSKNINNDNNNFYSKKNNKNTNKIENSLDNLRSLIISSLILNPSIENIYINKSQNKLTINDLKIFEKIRKLNSKEEKIKKLVNEKLFSEKLLNNEEDFKRAFINYDQQTQFLNAQKIQKKLAILYHELKVTNNEEEREIIYKKIENLINIKRNF